MAGLGRNLHVCQFQTVSTKGFTPVNCAKIVPVVNLKEPQKTPFSGASCRGAEWPADAFQGDASL